MNIIGKVPVFSLFVYSVTVAKKRNSKRWILGYLWPRYWILFTGNIVHAGNGIMQKYKYTKIATPTTQTQCLLPYYSKVLTYVSSTFQDTSWKVHCNKSRATNPKTSKDTKKQVTMIYLGNYTCHWWCGSSMFLVFTVIRRLIKSMKRKAWSGIVDNKSTVSLAPRKCFFVFDFILS